MIITNICQVHGHKEKAYESRQRGDSDADCDADAVVDGGGGGGGHGGDGDGSRYGDAGVIMFIIITARCLVKQTGTKS